jgi:hypothetical protein
MHAIKQVSGLLGNRDIDFWESFARWVPHLVGAQQDDIIVAMDRIGSHGDDQATLALLDWLGPLGITVPRGRKGRRGDTKGRGAQHPPQCR